jgi:hypothetical protein
MVEANRFHERVTSDISLHFSHVEPLSATVQKDIQHRRERARPQLPS